MFRVILFHQPNVYSFVNVHTYGETNVLDFFEATSDLVSEC